jgi:hypothetical protein
MVVFGPILTDDDSYGLAVVETDDEQALREFTAQDPVVTTGTATFEFGRMAAGHIRGHWPARRTIASEPPTCSAPPPGGSVPATPLH